MAKRKTVKRKAAKRRARPLVKWAPLPKSDATNAFELLGDVCKAILEEPPRYDQGTFLRLLRNKRLTRRPPSAPQCGTAGCVAGWSLILAGRDPIKLDNNRFGLIEDNAASLLGLDHIQAEELFTADAIDGIAYEVLNVDMPDEGTLGYALLGVVHITKFMLKYAGHLKAHKLPR